jgi:hypothetical protein
MFRDIFNYILLATIKHDFSKYVPLLTQTPETALFLGGREGVNGRHVVRNFLLLKLVNLNYLYE